MATVRDRRTGQLVDIPQERLAAELLTGQYDVDPTERVAIVDNMGHVGTITAESLFQNGLQGLDSVGYRIPTPTEITDQRNEQQYGQGVAQLRAAVEGAGRGLSFGLSDAAMVALGADAEGIRQRKERNPLISGGGEALGIIGGVLASGGTSGIAEGGAGLLRGGLGVLRASPTALLARGASAAERGLATSLGGGMLSKVGAGAVAGAVEGAAYGAGAEISDAALEDHELTAERLLASMKTGAIWGGGTTAAFGSVAPLLGVAKRGASKAVERITPAAFAKSIKNQSLEQLAATSAFDAAKGAGGGLKFVKKAKQQFGDEAKQIVGRELLDEGVVKMDSTLDDVVRLAREQRKAWGERIGESMRELDTNAPLSMKPKRKEIADRLYEEVIDPLKNGRLPTQQRLGDRVEKELGQYLGEGEFVRADADVVLGFEDLHQYRAELDRLAYPKGKFSDPTPFQAELQKARGIIEDELEKAADKASSKMGDAFSRTYKGAKRKYSIMSIADEMSTDALARLDTNRNFSLSDMITAQGVGVAAGIGEYLTTGDLDMGTLATAFIAGRLHRFVRTRGSAILAGTLDAASRMTRADKIEAIANTAKRTQTTTELAATRFIGTAKELPGKTKRLLAPAAVRFLGENKSLYNQYKETNDRIDKALSNPEQVASRAVESMEAVQDAAPQTTIAMTAAITRAATFLKSKQPTLNMRSSDIYSLTNDYQTVSDSEISKYLRYVEAVENPLKTIQDFGETGYMSLEASETLRKVYPKLYQGLEESIVDRLTNATEKINYQQLQILSMVFNRPFHPTYEPSFIRMTQRVHMDINDKNNKEGLSRGNRRAPELSKNDLTYSQMLSG